MSQSFVYIVNEGGYFVFDTLEAALDSWKTSFSNMSTTCVTKMSESRLHVRTGETVVYDVHLDGGGRHGELVGTIHRVLLRHRATHL